MTGGVSLAIWMGGIAAEIDQLVRARDAAQEDHPSRGSIEELLDLAGYEPRVDVVSGTSAGGVNGALLAAGSGAAQSLDGLRNLSVDVASGSTSCCDRRIQRDPAVADEGRRVLHDETAGRRSRTLLGDKKVDGQA